MQRPGNCVNGDARAVCCEPAVRPVDREPVHVERSGGERQCQRAGACVHSRPGEVQREHGSGPGRSGADDATHPRQREASDRDAREPGDRDGRASGR